MRQIQGVLPYTPVVYSLAVKQMEITHATKTELREAIEKLRSELKASHAALDAKIKELEKQIAEHTHK